MHCLFCNLHKLNTCDHITPLLHELHWLLVQKQIAFKVTTLVYHSLSDMAPTYLAADCQLSSEEGHCQLFCRLDGLRRQATLETDVSWLPAQRCGLANGHRGYEQFKRLLKTDFFGC